jgi:biotin carboxyl carrier protein
MEKKEADKLNIDQTLYTTRLSRRYAARKAYTPPNPGRIYSFIPGTVTEVMVRQGDNVTKGDDILILEAMKMKNRLKSHVSGKVVSINVNPGDRVSKGMVLVEIG